MLRDMKLLGLAVRDRVTGFEGIVTSVGFDLFGCVQAVVTPKMKEPAKIEDSRWMDTSRLEVLSAEPVMRQPSFPEVPEVNVLDPESKPSSTKGGAEKTIPRRMP